MKDEQVTFDGIPIPLTLETLLNAMIAGVADMYLAHSLRNDAVYKRKERQVQAFRERILRVDAEKDWDIELLKTEMLQKDARIAELEEALGKYYPEVRTK